MMLRVCKVLGLALSILAAGPCLAQDYFAGKTVTILVGGAGGGYDIYSRFLAPFYGRHLPGKP